MSKREVIVAVVLAGACLASWELSVEAFGSLDTESNLVGGMWAVISTVFVLRARLAESRRLARTRLLATGAAFVACLAYLVLFPFTPLGMALLIGAASLVVTRVWGPEAMVTTGITIAVVMVVSELGADDDRWLQPILRALDTAIGVAIGLAAAWLIESIAGRERQEGAG